MAPDGSPAVAAAPATIQLARKLPRPLSWRAETLGTTILAAVVDVLPPRE